MLRSETIQEMEPIVQVEGFHHYTISVADLDEAAKWYRRVFGFKLVYGNEHHPWGKVAYLQAPGFLLEMFEVPAPVPVPVYAAGPEPDTDLTVCGHKHLALLHGSVTEAVRQLEGLGVAVVSQKRVQLEGVGEFAAAFIVDDTGMLIELPEGDDTPSSASSSTASATGPIGGPLAIQRLHHVALCVPDREAAVDWYVRTLGFSVATSFEIEAIGLRSAFMQGPDLWVELHCLAGAAPVPPERRDPRTDLQTLGNKYFALAIKDSEQTSERLGEAGVDIIAAESAHGTHRVFISDNAGNPVELFQLMN
jgi:methylmalonyl-CoA/ethylmalonyl-CoA epimerase